MRCGNEEPSCLNCVAYKEVCKYVEGPKKARPSNHRILKLEEENRKLQEKLAEQAKKSPDDTSNSASPQDQRRSPGGPHDIDDESEPSSTSSSEITKERENPEYHGPSSVFFDEAPPGEENARGERSNPRMTTDLTAEAAIQSSSSPSMFGAYVLTVSQDSSRPCACHRMNLIMMMWSLNLPQSYCPFTGLGRMPCSCSFTGLHSTSHGPREARISRKSCSTPCTLAPPDMSLTQLTDLSVRVWQKDSVGDSNNS